ncbi:MAG: VanZ family protein, partial [Glaciimonas sp.]|nr:VanZ family protein [Glaciimonas sp.]
MIGSKLATRHRSSAFVRISLLIYLLLIAYASWYPFIGWRDLGISPLAFLTAKLPYYWTVFDVWVNVAGYLPLGLLMVLVLPRRLHFVAAIVAATLIGMLTSGTMEAVQTFLPTRISDKLDFVINSIGTLIGGILGVMLRSQFDSDSKIFRLREYWFNRDASRGMVVVGLWPLAQLTPLSHLFGFGQLSTMTSTWLSKWFEQPINIVGWLTNEAQLTAEQYWMLETIVTACGLIGAGLTLLIVLRKGAPKFLLAVLLLLTTLLVKTFASALLFTPENAFVWLTPGALIGLLIGVLILIGFSFVPRN